jgi:hypothetical protein
MNVSAKKFIRAAGAAGLILLNGCVAMQFTVRQADVAPVIRIETAADGSGSAITARTLAESAPLTLYAIKRSYAGEYIGPASAAVWSASDDLGYFTVPKGATTQFVPNHAAGTLTIQAAEGATRSPATGAINVTYAIAAIPDLAFWAKADSISGHANGEPVETWRDSSRFSSNAVQANIPEMPKFYSGVVNQRPVLRFDGVQSKLSFPGEVAVATDYTLFVVGARTTGSHENMFLGGTTAGTRLNLAFGWRQDSGGFMPLTFNLAHYGNDVWGTSSAFSAKTFERWTGQFSSATGKTIYRNGTLFATNASNIQPLISATGTMIGYWPMQSVGFEGDIAEILFYRRALSTTERQAVESYLSAKYGI